MHKDYDFYKFVMKKAHYFLKYKKMVKVSGDDPIFSNQILLKKEGEYFDKIK